MLLGTHIIKRNKLIQKVKDYLQEDADNTELDENTMEGAEEGILVGRKELAESLLNQIDRWEKADEC